MADRFFNLPQQERREALGVAATRSGRPTYLLEKDIWVVWSLAALFESDLGGELVLKGGTSLSKAYRAIRRFSEDIDVTYNIRALIPDLIDHSPDPVPTNRSQQEKWSKAIRQRLQTWVEEYALPLMAKRLEEFGTSVKAYSAGNSVYIEYTPLTEGYGYVASTVNLEFGSRSTGEPCEERQITCDASEALPSIEFPQARPRVMLPERTFWEKATAMHVFCLAHKLKGERYARHWHDLTRLDSTGYADRALKDRETAREVARHKAIFFSEKDTHGRRIDYQAAVSGGLRIVPKGEARKVLEEDYDRMIEANLLLDDVEPFDSIMDRCQALEEKSNEVSQR